MTATCQAATFTSMSLFSLTYFAIVGLSHNTTVGWEVRGGVIGSSSTLNPLRRYFFIFDCLLVNKQNFERAV